MPKACRHLANETAAARHGRFAGLSFNQIGRFANVPVKEMSHTDGVVVLLL